MATGVSTRTPRITTRPRSEAGVSAAIARPITLDWRLIEDWIGIWTVLIAW